MIFWPTGNECAGSSGHTSHQPRDIVDIGTAAVGVLGPAEGEGAGVEEAEAAVLLLDPPGLELLLPGGGGEDVLHLGPVHLQVELHQPAVTRLQVIRVVVHQHKLPPVDSAPYVTTHSLP